MRKAIEQGKLSKNKQSECEKVENKTNNKFDQNEEFRCDGTGKCFCPDDTAGTSYSKAFKCTCELKKCSNFVICQREAPKYILRSFNERCMDCDSILFTNLKIEKEKHKCGVCNKKSNEYTLMPGCKDKLCLECFKNAYSSLVNNESTEIYINCPLCKAKHIPRYL